MGIDFMRNRRNSLLHVLTAAAVLVSVSFGSAADGEAPQVATSDFEAMYVDRDTRVRLSDFNGQVVLLNFWASWCYPCLVEMPEFQKIQDRFRDRGFTVLAVAVYDKLPDARAFQEQYKFTFPVLFDVGESARMAFDVKVVPQTFLIGRDGTLVPIPNPKTKESKLRVNDPTVWVQPETYEFLENLIGKT